MAAEHDRARRPADGEPGADHPAGEIRVPSAPDAASRLYAKAGVLVATVPAVGLAAALVITPSSTIITGGGG